MKRWQVLMVYVVLGPPLGGLVFWVAWAVALAVVSEPPTAGAALGSLMPSMNALVALLYILAGSYVAGLPAAFAAGVTHALLFRRVSPALLVGLVCVAGVAALLVPSLLLRPDDLRWPWPFIAMNAVLPPLISAAILSTSLARRVGDGREQRRDRPA